MIVTLVGHATGSCAVSTSLRSASRCSRTDGHSRRCRAIAKTFSSSLNQVKVQPSISAPVRVLCSRLLPVEARDPHGCTCSGSNLRDGEHADCDSSSAPRAETRSSCILPYRAGYTLQAGMKLTSIGGRHCMQRLLQKRSTSFLNLRMKKPGA